MTATDELRADLTKRGVNWDYGITGATTTKFRANGVDITFMPMRDGLICTTILTAAQAIAITLDAEVCHEVEDEDTGFIVCSECGAVHDTDYTNYYCWCCGRKVMDE